MTNGYSDYLQHHGVKGMHWGIRRYQNPDGTLIRNGYDRKISKLRSMAEENPKKAHKINKKITNIKYKKNEHAEELVKQANRRQEIRDSDKLEKRYLDANPRQRRIDKAMAGVGLGAFTAAGTFAPFMSVFAGQYAHRMYSNSSDKATQRYIKQRIKKLDKLGYTVKPQQTNFQLIENNVDLGSLKTSRYALNNKVKKKYSRRIIPSSNLENGKVYRWSRAFEP